MATEKISIIDVDEAQAGWDYSTLDEWEDDFGSSGGVTDDDLVSNDEIAVAECCASSGGDDTTLATIDGWKTDATRYIEIRLHSSETNTGVWNDANYVLSYTNSELGLYTRDEYVRILNIQFEVTQSGSSEATGISAKDIAGSPGEIRIGYCIFKGVCSGTGSARAMRLNDGDIAFKIYNNVIYGFYILNDSGFAGIWADDSSTCDIWNNTINDCYYGIKRDAGTVNVTNNLIFECTDDLSGTFNTITYNATDDDHTGDGAGNFQITQTDDDYAALVIDADGGDYNVTDDSSELYNTCNGDPSGGLYADDIIGTARDGNWDIGAFELVVVGGLSMPVAMHHYTKNIASGR
ncbi:hypothetical protein KAR91_06350 [Candidatus Pacearchaeota archaeon]|nr:hypothetical protein [Candidatus Pacearchaeota archaeon]